MANTPAPSNYYVEIDVFIEDVDLTVRYHTSLGSMVNATYGALEIEPLDANSWEDFERHIEAKARDAYGAIKIVKLYALKNTNFSRAYKKLIEEMFAQDDIEETYGDSAANFFGEPDRITLEGSYRDEDDIETINNMNTSKDNKDELTDKDIWDD